MSWIRFGAGAGAAFVLVVAAFSYWALSPSPPLDARYTADACRRVAPEIRGVEDLDLLPDGRVLLSAHDRRAHIHGGATRLPDGALYALDRATLSVTELWPRDMPQEGGFHPHGVAVFGNRVAVINRRWRDGGPPAGGTRIALFRIAENRLERAGTLSDPGLCRANDLAPVGDGLLVSLDGGGCVSSIGETLLGGGGAVVEIAAEAIDQGRLDTPLLRKFPVDLNFANGVLSRADGVWTAETRGGGLRSSQGARIATPGGPDNLTRDGAAMVLALHPNLLRLALHRRGWGPSAPSRIVRITPPSERDGSTGEAGVEILFDDPTGRIFAGATVGLALRDDPAGGEALLIAGAHERGLLLCGGAHQEGGS
ncbi:MAG: hypothetical protein AAF909_02870 [Pseudomonadota bacterium]